MSEKYDNNEHNWVTSAFGMCVSCAWIVDTVSKTLIPDSSFIACWNFQLESVQEVQSVLLHYFRDSKFRMVKLIWNSVIDENMCCKTDWSSWTLSPCNEAWIRFDENHSHFNANELHKNHKIGSLSGWNEAKISFRLKWFYWQRHVDDFMMVKVWRL